MTANWKQADPIMKYIVSIIVSLLIVSNGAHALAQTSPIQDAITEGSQIETVIRERERADALRREPVTEIEGETGIFVLRVNEIFFIDAGAELGYSDNPARTSVKSNGSFYTSFWTSGGVQTRLGELIDAGASATASGVQYFDGDAPSSRNLSGTLNFGYPIPDTPLYAGVNVFGGFNYDEKFRDPSSFYGASTSLSALFPVTDRIVLRSALGLTRQWSERSENDNTSVFGGLTLIGGIAERTSASLDCRLAHAWFDDFFEDVTFVERRDLTLTASAKISHQLADAVTFSVGVTYEKRWSELDLSEYETNEVSIVAGMSYWF